MGETMSFSSLVLMVGVALLYPPVLRRLRATPDAWPRSSRDLWKVILPFALLSWGLAYLWSQAPHSPTLSLALILGILALFGLSFAALLGATWRRSGSLGLLLLGLLAYTGICWAVTSLWAAVAPTTIEGQAILLGYLLLGPTLIAILLPRPAPPD